MLRPVTGLCLKAFVYGEFAGQDDFIRGNEDTIIFRCVVLALPFKRILGVRPVHVEAWLAKATEWRHHVISRVKLPRVTLHRLGASPGGSSPTPRVQRRPGAGETMVGAVTTHHA